MRSPVEPGPAPDMAAPALSQRAEPTSAALRPSFESPIFSPEPLGGDLRLETREPLQRKREQQIQQRPASAPQESARLRVSGARVLRDVSIIDGFRIGSEGLVIQLAGIAPAPQGSECRRLDGVVEPCAQRAANRLEILTRGRPVVCDLQETSAGAVQGACRAGKIDLADDLVRNGLAVRTSSRL